MTIDLLHTDTNPTPQTDDASTPIAPQPSAPPPPVVKKNTVNIPKTPLTIPTKFVPIIIGCSAIVTGIVVFFAIKGMQPAPKPPDPVTIIVTPTPSPTPIRVVTAVSTSSQFISFVENISSLSAKLKDFEREDPSLAPPSLTLPLGF